MGHDKLSTYGLLGEHRISAIREWIEQLVAQDYLAKVGEFNTLEITEQGRALLKGAGSPQLLKPVRAGRERRAREAAGADSWEGVDRGLFERLRALRTKLAAERGVPPYVVFDDAALRDMARRRPSTLSAFLGVRGVGERKREDYGAAFVEAIVDYCTANNIELEIKASGPLPLVGRGQTSSGDPKSPERRAVARRGAAREGGEAPRGPNASAASAFIHFRRGASIEEVMQRMGRARSTVCRYLQTYLRHEQVTDSNPWVNSAVARQIEEALETVDPGPLKPVFEHLDGKVSYDDIRIVAACIANRRS
jgi:ATP-dependent DNA helicase RecQ